MNKQLLIFDFDGTLIDSVPDLADATNTMLTTLGKDTYPIETIRNWIGNGSRLLVERALVGKVEVAEGELTVEEADHAEQIFFEAYKNLSGSKTVAYPDVDDGLKRLHAAGYTLALVTNKPIRFVPKILQSFGWQDLFSEVMGGDSLAVKKPDPTPLLHVCETLNFSVEQSVMIGDSRNDMLAGQNANMDTLGLSYGYNYGQDIRELNPTEAFDHFADLVAWIMKDRF
ncbi:MULTISPECIES: phosphoglycolate phosphatase [unclassified Psychrobacter]|uniref:phosphoglycolate phosphatase n=1 Tax=unclassified Psychrobacter TaxID=196806 RepID=UPI000C7E290A|nr:MULTISPECIES: phosphoglycolate phosphatase [unclassified Psychrobacter]PKH81392.1 phosphoglycolate phosphatase [Psychrobacter sp. 4Bb]